MYLCLYQNALPRPNIDLFKKNDYLIQIAEKAKILKMNWSVKNNKNILMLEIYFIRGEC